jgi:hypothetical protein
MGEDIKVYKVLVGKPEGKIPLRRPRRRWEDGVRINLREIGLGGVAWIRLAQDRDRWEAVVSAVRNLRVLAPRREFKGEGIKFSGGYRSNALQDLQHDMCHEIFSLQRH